MRKLNFTKIQTLIDLAVQEDYGQGDPTTLITIPSNSVMKTAIVTREEIVVSGIELVGEILKRYSADISLRIYKKDGERANVADKLAIMEGPARAMLSAERVVLNFLQRLSGIATTTYKYVVAVRGTNAKIYDTRKTIPGWRELEKYAVRCGKGHNHRYNLGEAVMIKDNHFVELGEGEKIVTRLKKLIQEANDIPTVKFISVEVDHVDEQLNYVLQVPGIDIILLDNMGQWQYKHAVEMRNKMCGKKPLLEASGGITLQNVRQVAQCGVDRISVGAITHGAISVDIGLDRIGGIDL
jgi:nicotinate-nucleotide pyrophosphorylase (carboxylating)